MIEAADLNPKASPKRPQAGGRFPSTDLLLNKPHQRDTKILYTQSSENSSLGEVQDLDPKTTEYNSENESLIESSALINQNLEINDAKSDSDENKFTKENDLNFSVSCQLSDNITTERQLELCDKKIQQETFVERSLATSKIEETHSVGIDDNEVTEENANEENPGKSTSFNYPRANLNGALQLVQSEEPPLTHCESSMVIEKEARPQILRSFTGNSVRSESCPYVPGEWLSEKYLKTKAIGAIQD